MNPALSMYYKNNLSNQNKLKIIHVNTSDGGGGAAIAAYRLNQAFNLSHENIESKLIVRNKITFNESCVSVHSRMNKFSKVKRKLLYLIHKLTLKKLLNPFGTFSLNNGLYKISKIKEVREADIIYIHWCNDSFLSIKELIRILNLGKPTYFFLHDMWLMTGGCHYSLDCIGFKKDCNNCPLLGNKRFAKLPARLLRKKKKLLKFNNLTIISPSHWMDKNVSESSVLKNLKHVMIPNTLSTQVFKPIEKLTARKILNLPFNKKLIMFVAIGGTSNTYKGWNKLLDTLSMLDKDESIELVVIGNNVSKEDQKTIGMKIHSFGKISDEISLPIFYSAVDLFVIPSLADNAPQVVVEAQSCGCPVVGFKNGGIPDVILPSEINNLVSSGDSQALYHKIREILNVSYPEYVRNDRHNEVYAKFGQEKIVNKHKTLWKQTN